MSSEQTMFLVTCPICQSLVELQGTLQEDEYTRLWLSCNCRTTICLYCSNIVMDCSDSRSRIYPLCGYCNWDALELDVDYSKTRSFQAFYRGSKEIAKETAINSIRKKYIRAYKKWSQTEALCMKFLEEQGRTNEDLVQIFQRQPSAINFRSKLNYSKANEIPFAAHILGKQILCSSCGKISLFTYSFFEQCCSKLEISEDNFMELTLQYLLTKLNCTECKMKKAKVIVSDESQLAIV